MKKSVLSIVAIAIAVITMSSCSKDPAYEGKSDSFSTGTSSEMTEEDKAALDFIANGLLSYDDYEFTYTVAQGTLSSSDYESLSNQVKNFNTKSEAVPAVAVAALVFAQFEDRADQIQSLLKQYKANGYEGMMVIATAKNSKGKIIDTKTWK